MWVTRGEVLSLRMCGTDQHALMSSRLGYVHTAGLQLGPSFHSARSGRERRQRSGGGGLRRALRPVRKRFSDSSRIYLPFC